MTSTLSTSYIQNVVVMHRAAAGHFWNLASAQWVKKNSVAEYKFKQIIYNALNEIWYQIECATWLLETREPKKKKRESRHRARQIWDLETSGFPNPTQKGLEKHGFCREFLSRSEDPKMPLKQLQLFYSLYNQMWIDKGFGSNGGLSRRSGGLPEVILFLLCAKEMH